MITTNYLSTYKYTYYNKQTKNNSVKKYSIWIIKYDSLNLFQNFNMCEFYIYIYIYLSKIH